jgi:creatinine amidohydrolase
MLHSFIPPQRFLPYLNWKDIENMPDKENVVIIQPIGSIEQHGWHLPIIVDSAISIAILGKALSKLEGNIPAYALPNIYYGKSNEHSHFPGTITLTTETLYSLLLEVGESIYRAGFRKFFLLNSHGGQPQILEIVATDLHMKYDDFCIFPLFMWNVPNVSKDLLTSQELEIGIHAGDAETSLMLSILPEQVKMTNAVTEYPQDLPTDSWLTINGKLPFAWATKDLSQSGVLGDPKVATKEKGDLIWESLANGLVKIIQDIHKFKQPQTS